MPTAQVSQMVAAVVSPRTALRRTKIRPPPMKPMPETIWAATRDGPKDTFGRPSTWVKPCCDTSIISALATPTSVWVRRPALFCCASLSQPIRLDSSSAGPSSASWRRP